MSAFLHYWQPEQVDDHMRAARVLRHAGSEQFGRVQRGDIVWIVTVRSADHQSRKGQLALIGKLQVGERIRGDEARRRFGNPYEATFHLVAKPGTEEEWRDISLMNSVEDLRFESQRGESQLTLDDRGRVNAQQLQALRKLTPASARYVQATWEAAATGAHAPRVPTTVLDEIQRFAHTLPEAETTERQMLIQSRLGQGIFRERLIAYWDGCAITGSRMFSVLKASHIKPWRVANNYERLDPYNGLLLLANLDAAFDAGLITFDHHGSIMISSQLSEHECNLLGVRSDMHLRKIEDTHRSYLAYHRTEVFKP